MRVCGNGFGSLLACRQNSSQCLEATFDILCYSRLGLCGDGCCGALFVRNGSKGCRLEDFILCRPLECLFVARAGYVSPLALEAAWGSLIALELQWVLAGFLT